MAPRKNSSKNPRKESVDSGYGPSVTSSLRKGFVASSKLNTATKCNHRKDISDAESPEEFDSIYDNFTPQEKVEFHQVIDKILDECEVPDPPMDPWDIVARAGISEKEQMRMKKEEEIEKLKLEKEQKNK